jgi:hypothetical protein
MVNLEELKKIKLEKRIDQKDKYFTEIKWKQIENLAVEWLRTGARGRALTFMRHAWKSNSKINYTRCQELMKNIVYAYESIDTLTLHTDKD